MLVVHDFLNASDLRRVNRKHSLVPSHFDVSIFVHIIRIGVAMRMATARIDHDCFVRSVYWATERGRSDIDLQYKRNNAHNRLEKAAFVQS